MRGLICVFVDRICKKQIFSWRGLILYRFLTIAFLSTYSAQGSYAGPWYLLFVCFSCFAIISAHPRRHGSYNADDYTHRDRGTNQHTGSYPGSATVKHRRHSGQKMSHFIVAKPDKKVHVYPGISSLSSLTPLPWKILPDEKSIRNTSNNRHRKHHGTNKSDPPKVRSLKNIYGYMYGFYNGRTPLDSLASGIIG